MSQGPRPLAGVRVADFGQLTAGANTSAMLADLGADVIKIESASYMDLFRHWRPVAGTDWWNRSPQFHFTNRNKRGASLDLKHPEGRRLALELIARCDVVVENYSRGVLDRLGLDYATVSARNPKIVYASVTSQGETGPFCMHRTYGSTLDAMGGLAALTGYAGGEPLISGGDFNYPDQVVSLIAAGLIIAALREARRTGRGGHLDISQREVVSFLLGEEIGAASVALDAAPASPQGNAERDLLLQDCFQSSDGRWVAVTVAGTIEAGRLHKLVGGGEDLRVATADWLILMTVDSALRALRAAEIPAAAVNDGRDLFAAPELAGTSLVQSDDGSLYKGMPYSIVGPPFVAARPAPDLGADTRDILRAILGLDDHALDELEASGVTSCTPKG